MANELIKPIDETTAKAIEESAKAIGKGFTWSAASALTWLALLAECRKISSDSWSETG